MRNDIQFLRALSVLVVVFFHLGVLKNGYLGVDIFFVISGYIITTNIRREFFLGDFNIFKFYVKRIRRLFPVLIFVYSVVLVFGFIFMLPDDLENLAQSVIASFFGLNNYLLMISSGDYWSVANDYKPLMHTWSLGIEEQFYLIYPAFLIFAFKLAPKLQLILFYISFISFSIFFATENSDIKTFYLLNNRVFEFFFGALIIYLPDLKDSKWLRYLSLLSLTSAIVILLSNIEVGKMELFVFLFFVSSFIYINKVVPILNFIVNDRFIIGIGTMSYSIYLWHQPILAFMRYMFSEMSSIHYILYFLSLMVFSWCSYNYIEIRFRNSSLISSRNFRIILIPLVTFILLNSTFLVGVSGCYKDFEELRMSRVGFKFEKIWNRDLNPYKAQNENVKLNKNFDVLDSSKLVILIVGDSYGRDLFNVLQKMPLIKPARILYEDFYNIDPNRFATVQKESDFIFFCIQAKFLKSDYELFVKKNLLEEDNKIVVFGPKYFGASMGPVYVNSFFREKIARASIDPEPEFLKIDRVMGLDWKGRYVSMLNKTFDRDGRKLLCTNEKGEFYSYDGSHLTAAGIEFYQVCLEKEINNLIKK
jgi:peptidoglycan/LPS O-acetylase OafA/YrhL